jgi:hypothetical protein
MTHTTKLHLSVNVRLAALLFWKQIDMTRSSMPDPQQACFGLLPLASNHDGKAKT